MMLTQPVVIEAESDDAGRYWCPEAGCSKSFADRSKQNFKGFRKYENAYYHYEQERKKSNGHAGLYCKSASHRETNQLDSMATFQYVLTTEIQPADEIIYCSPERLAFLNA